MDEMMAALWYRREPSTALKAMRYGEMRYWFDVHLVMVKAERTKPISPPA